MEYKALIGSNDQVHKKLPKLLSFKFKVPPGFHNSFTMTVENKDYDNSGKEIDFCTIAIGKSKFLNLFLGAYISPALSTQAGRKSFEKKIQLVKVF